ncbi:hypothetical protein POM88_017186 [Heracleum sosnowskyi]|uniref:Uncharacterized protein n=1 Tax=Heracleum sosnowskyi TaxID=360622 RepID=A0AAD8IQC5_9APIA|nr:hypothetical protein POM88_017186 [Heracleum sosnowskyi]
MVNVYVQHHGTFDSYKLLYTGGVEKEGHQGERSNNKPKIPYKPKRKANVSWRNQNNEQKDATEEDIIYEIDQSEADDEQEHDHTQRKPKLTVRRRLPVSLRED